MGVADETDVTHAHAVPCKLVLDHVLMELEPAHAERLHDLVGAVAGVDDDWMGAAGDKKAERQHPPGAPAVATEHEKTRFQLNVPIVKNLDFERHILPPVPCFAFSRRA